VHVQGFRGLLQGRYSAFALWQGKGFGPSRPRFSKATFCANFGCWLRAIIGSLVLLLIRKNRAWGIISDQCSMLRENLLFCYGNRFKFWKGWEGKEEVKNCTAAWGARHNAMHVCAGAGQAGACERPVRAGGAQRTRAMARTRAVDGHDKSWGHTAQATWAWLGLPGWGWTMEMPPPFHRGVGRIMLRFVYHRQTVGASEKHTDAGDTGQLQCASVLTYSTV
jgi:hypothetical protein